MELNSAQPALSVGLGSMRQPLWSGGCYPQWCWREQVGKPGSKCQRKEVQIQKEEKTRKNPWY